ncbi:AraC family transcriptional regulator [Williamsia sp. 1138]|uniref:AraC family transcriptional regulator n=1 Tax=Gordonia rubripertincta TaxID=36822 RepID=A0ABT4MXW4_GORRU|nr:MULTISPECIES: AraC family transcriptional regulator [Mycobacteriales]MCZ4550871.1 AraC family transcriptional regulator [Gordonia rubripertincta]OZG27237.1 AraC family transcriptional regulator [Williamsia sp. 1138]
MKRPAAPRGELRPDRGGVRLTRVPLPPGDLLRHVWFAQWDLDTPALQPVLEHPGGNVVVEPDRAALYCVSQGTTERKLEATGWAAGVLLRPAAITIMTGRSMTSGSRTGPALPIGEPLPIPCDGGLSTRIREVMTAEKTPSGESFDTVADLFDRWSRQWTVDDEGVLINQIVDAVENENGPRRVGDLAASVNMSTRALQRLTIHRTGLSPKWLIQRRRLQDAALALRRGDSSIADVAAQLGYADQAHLAREFKAVIGQTPSEYVGAVRSMDH